ncbi:hypothetical protein [Changchengzhania lutea]|uniref:hypothetical protein n=1 Tax=Changchengzhania lutea TaxID=2049305 RepID=UPI00115D8ECF|nr:hypothetical protein [Changchengzhania lutea]
METGMIVITTTLIVICILPFILLYGSTKKKIKQLKKALENGISRHNGTLTDYVINNDFAIGLDSAAKQIYYYKKTPEGGYLQKVDLNKIKSCEVKKETRRLRNSKSNHETIQRIALEFTSIANNVIEQFEFYDYNDSSQPNGELAQADSWMKKVNDLLTKDSTNLKKPKTKKTSLKFA